MITGEIAATGGEVYINGFKVSTEIERVHENIGYCPQTDAIIPLLTAREHLMFFSRLRAYQSNMFTRRVNGRILRFYLKKNNSLLIKSFFKTKFSLSLNRVGLRNYADRRSGGKNFKNN